MSVPKGPSDDKLALLQEPYKRAIQYLTVMIRDFNAVSSDKDHYRFYPPQISIKINAELANLKSAFKAIMPELCIFCGGVKCSKCAFTGCNPSNKNDP